MARGFTRRTFLAGSAVGAATAWLRPLARAAAPGRELIVGAVKFIADGKLNHAFLAVDGAGKPEVEIPLDFHFHGFAAHPSERRRAVLFEKQGPGACEVDLVARKIVRPLRTAAERHFYGHGAFSPDGTLLYATETVLKTLEGVIIVRDGATLAPKGEFPSFGAQPHDCLLVDRGRTLLITNGGGKLEAGASPPCVTTVDVATRKLRERLTFDNPRVNAGHLTYTSDRRLVVVSAPRSGLPKTDPGGISLRAGAGLHTLAEPADVTRRMLGETLSLAVHEPSSLVGATNPDADLLTFWDYKRGRLVKAVTLEKARGITLTRDRRWFAVSHGQVPALAFFSTATLTADPARAAPQAHLSGSHLYNWTL